MRLSNFLLITLITYSEAGMSSAIASKDKLVIGIAQFPSTLHPNIDTVAAKSYIHAMTARHFTVFDKDWKLICMLFIKLPTIENGLAKKNTWWKKELSVTYSIHSEASWGDGVAVSSKDVLLAWEVRKHPKSGVGNMGLYRKIYKIDVKTLKLLLLISIN